MPYKKTSKTISFEDIAANARAMNEIKNNHTDDQSDYNTDDHDDDHDDHQDDGTFTTHFPNSKVTIKLFDKPVTHFKANKTTVNDNSTDQKPDEPQIAPDMKHHISENPSIAADEPSIAPDEPSIAPDEPSIAPEENQEVETPVNNGSDMNLMLEQAQNTAQDNTAATAEMTNEIINFMSINSEFKIKVIKALDVARRIQTPSPTSHFTSCINLNKHKHINSGHKGNTFSPTILINKIDSPISEEPITQTVKNPSKIKTKICTFFMKGECTKGDNCTFIHNEQVAQSTQNVKDTSKEIGNVIAPLCRYGQSCTHLANGECKFGHYKSHVMNFNLARKQVGLQPVKAGVIYPDIRHNENNKKHTHNKQQSVAV